MAHTHLVLAYAITVLMQLGYAGWVGLKYRETESWSAPSHPIPPGPVSP